MKKKEYLALHIIIATSLICLAFSTDMTKGENIVNHSSVVSPTSVWTPMTFHLNDTFGSIIGGQKSMILGRLPIHEVGDVNNDGFDDVLIVATGISNEAFLFFGRGAGFPKNASTNSADVILRCNYSNPHLMICSGAGDVNKDGYDDFLISDYYYSSDNQTYRGKVFLIFGKALEEWPSIYYLEQSNASFIGEKTMSTAGMQVCGLGDVNGDGIDDFAIGAPYHTSNQTSYCGMVYIIFGKRSEWGQDIILNQLNTNASFYGEDQNDQIGKIARMSSIGDVNGDGLNDVLIGSLDMGNTVYGESYLILGRKDNWPIEGNIHDHCIASFEGEVLYSGPVGGRGDINDDGFDDILIGSYYNYNKTGTANLFFGKKTGWKKDTPLSDADVIFIGDNESQTGRSVSIIGDINRDGIDDIAIAASWYNDTQYGEVGSVYVVKGRTYWSQTFDLPSESDYQYLGEGPAGSLGQPSRFGRAGDINGDGFDDMIVGSPAYGDDRGKVYIVTLGVITQQIIINSVKLFPDEEYSERITQAMKGDKIFVELEGSNSDKSNIDQAFVNVQCIGGVSLPLMLEETGINTGIYSGNFTLGGTLDTLRRTIPVDPWDNLTIYAVDDPTKNSSLLIDTYIDLYPDKKIFTPLEGEHFLQQFTTRGRDQAETWDVSFSKQVEWLTWNRNTKSLYGTPDNTEVGSLYVSINVTSTEGNYDLNDLFINVINKDPMITTMDKLDAYEDRKYYVDYDCDEDGEGDITWSISPELPFLTMDPETGILTGTPQNGDDGEYLVNVTVKDGNGGIGWSEFVLTVHDVNNAPMILTEDVTQVYEDSHYLVEYSGADRDWDDVLTWSLDTNCEWLMLDQQSLSLLGTPRNKDVGPHFVNISVSDGRGGLDYHNFTLDVINTNDPPVWISVSDDILMDQGNYVTLEFEAEDEDVVDILEYSIGSFPDIGLEIDPDNGTFIWEGTTEGLIRGDNGTYSMEVTVSATDGTVVIHHRFLITVIPNPSPMSSLDQPGDGEVVTISDLRFTWNGQDPDDEDLTYTLYIDEDPLKVLRHSSGCMIVEETDGGSFVPEDLEQGKTYYWTVIPFDGVSNGVCLDNVFEFHVNSPPELDSQEDREVIEGRYFQVTVHGYDPDPFVTQDVTYSIQSRPEGLTISETTGTITWIPDHDDIGGHEVTVICSDGMEETETTFTITVKELEDTGGGKDVKDEGENGVMIFLLILIVVAVILFGIMIIYMHTGRTEQKEFRDDEEDLPFLGEEEEPEEPLLAAEQEEELDGP